MALGNDKVQRGKLLYKKLLLQFYKIYGYSYIVQTTLTEQLFYKLRGQELCKKSPSIINPIPAPTN